MKAEWAVWKKVFSPDECRDILERSRDLPVEEAKLGLKGESFELEKRRTTLKWMNEHLYKDVFERMWFLTNKVNREFFQFHIDTLEYMQLGEYHEKNRGEYKRHHDVFWLNETDRHRKLSVVLQLTDPKTYEGGELVLNTQGQAPTTHFGQGTVIWFPSFLEHWVTPVTKGVRHSVVCWFEGPDWR